MLRKLENVYCPITRGGQVARAVKQIQHEVEYQRTIQTSIISASAYPSYQVKSACRTTSIQTETAVQKIDT